MRIALYRYAEGEIKGLNEELKQRAIECATELMANLLP